MQAGEREQRFERAECFAETFRNLGDGAVDSLLQPGKCLVADFDAVDLNPFIETEQMR